MSQKQRNSPLVSQKGGIPKMTRNLGPTVNWIQCDKCKEWVIFENSGISGKFDEKELADVKFDCRMCRMERRIEGVVGKVREVEGAVAEVKERVAKLEGIWGGDLGVLSGAVGELQDRVKEIGGEIDSRVAAGEERSKEKIDILERAVGEMRDGLCALGVKVEDLREEFPRPEKWVEVSGKTKKALSGDGVRKVEEGFGERYKTKAKDTVLVVGASLVRGVGQKLEGQSHIFSAVSKSGAKIENIEEEVTKLSDREDRHLVVMVGTNNIQREGSEVVLKKFKSLIERCKAVKNRMVTVVGIPKRYDLSWFQECRRLGVNVRLEQMCRESGVQFLPCEVERSKMWRDGVHFSDVGQDEFARKLFRHCVRFLD